MMGSPVVTFAVLLSCIFLLSVARGAYIGQSSSSGGAAGGEKAGGGRRGNGNGVDNFRQPDLPALYSAPRSHQEQESQDNEVDQQSSTDREGAAVGTTTEIYFDEREEGTSEDYQFTTGTTQNPRDFPQNSDQQSSSSSSVGLSQEKSPSTYTGQGRIGGYADVSAQRQKDNSNNNSNFHQSNNNDDQQRQQTQYQRRPLDQQQIENHLYPQQATISTSLTGGSEGGQSQFPNSFYGPPTQSITNASRSRQPETTTTTQGRQNNFNSSPVTGPASNANVQQQQEGGLVFQQTQTRYLPPFLPHIQQQQPQPQPRYQQQQVQQNQDSVYHVPIQIPPRMTIPPRDSIDSQLSQSAQQTGAAPFPPQPQQQQQQQQPENSIIYQQRQYQQQQNFDRPQPSLGQYLPPQTQVYNQPTTTEHVSNHNQVQQYQYHERQLPQVQQQQPQEQFHYLPPRNDATQQQQPQYQQPQQPATNFDNGITQIEANSAFEIDEPHDDSIVDAELLLRVQKIIEEHERQQKEIQDKFRRENEATEAFLQNNNNIQDPNYHGTNNVYFGPQQQQQQRAGNNDNNIQSSHGHFDGHNNIPQNFGAQSPSLSPSPGVQYTSQQQQEQQPRDSLNTQYGPPSFQQQQQQQFGGVERFPQGFSQNGHEDQYQRQVYQDVTNSINNVQRYNEPSSQAPQWSSLPSNAYRNVPTTRSNSSGIGSENDNSRSNIETTTSANRKQPSHIEYQKAILSDHFVETQTEFPTARSGGSRSFGTPRHQEYLPPSSSSENPAFDSSSRRGSFSPQFMSVSYGLPSQLNSKVNSNDFFRPDNNQGVRNNENEKHGGSPTYPILPNELPSRQQYENQNQHSSGVATPLANQIIVNPRPVYGLPTSEFEGRHQQALQQQQQQSSSTDGNAIAQYHQPESSSLSQPIPSNYNDNLIGNQAGGQLQQHQHHQQQIGGDRIADFPSPSSSSLPLQSSQDQLSQTYNSLTSLYPTSFTSNGHSRTIVVHEVPYGSAQGVTNRALITPTDLSPSSPSPSSSPNSDNQFFSHSHQPDSRNHNVQNNGFSSTRDNSYHAPSPTPNPSDNDVNFPHFSQTNNPISYQPQQQQQQQQQQQSSPSHHQIPQFLSNQQQTQQGDSSGNHDPEPRHYIPVSTPSHVFYSAPAYTSHSSSSLTPDSSAENQISTPQPIYGIPLAPALGLDSIVTSSIDNSDSSSHNLFASSQETSSQQQQQQQPQQKFISNENNYLPPSSSQPHHQEVGGVLSVEGGGNSNFNNDQLYLNHIISAYNALAAQQQAAWNQQQQQQEQEQEQSEDDVNNNSVVVSAFDQGRLSDTTAVVYGPPPSSSISSTNDYFYPRRNRSVSKRRLSSRRKAATSSSTSSATVAGDTSATKSVKEADEQ